MIMICKKMPCSLEVVGVVERLNYTHFANCNEVDIHHISG